MENKLELIKYEFIDHFETNEDWFANKLRIYFKNDYGISIIQGEYAYTDDNSEYEIAPLDKNHKLDGSLFDEQHQGDNVLGHCDVNLVNYYINKIGSL